MCDDAECHIRLLENVDIENGDRFIAWSTDTRNVEDVCASIDRLLPELGHATPEVTDPFPERIQAREQEMREIWAQCYYATIAFVTLSESSFDR